MFDKLSWVDTHWHAQDYSRNDLAIELEKAEIQNILYSISCALYPEQYDLIDSYQNFPNLYWSAGIHPQYLKYPDLSPVISLLDNKKIIAIGECGLDKNSSDWERQINLFTQQLILADSYNIPVILHVVKTPYEVLKIIKKFPKITYIYHSFSNSLEVYKDFLKLNTFFSLGSAILRDDKHLKILQQILLDGRYVFETDAPYQKAGFILDSINKPVYLINQLDFITKNSPITLESLKSTQFNNIKCIFT